jgi:hypothetical protein
VTKFDIAEVAVQGVAIVVMLVQDGSGSVRKEHSQSQRCSLSALSIEGRETAEDFSADICADFTGRKLIDAR